MFIPDNSNVAIVFHIKKNILSVKFVTIISVFKTVILINVFISILLSVYSPNALYFNATRKPSRQRVPQINISKFKAL